MPATQSASPSSFDAPGSVKSKRAAPSDLGLSIHKNLGPGTSLQVWCEHDLHGLRLRHAVSAMVAPSLCGEAPKHFALALLCPRKSWSSTSTAKPVGLAVGVAEPVLPSAPCVHKCTQLYIVLPTRSRTSAYTIAPLMPRAPPPRHNVVPRQQSSPAQ